MSTSTHEPKIYNLHTTGMGFINRLRRVDVKKGPSYYAVSIGALYGVVDDATGRAESSLYDLRVVTSRAIDATETLKTAFEEGKKIFIEFKAGDTHAEAFQYKSGVKAGTWGACIKGTLLDIRRAWVEGKLIIDTVEKPDNEIDAAIEQPVSSSSMQTEENDWRLKLNDLPKKIVVLNNDAEVNEKLRAIRNTGCYEEVLSAREDAICFVLAVAA